MIALTNVHVIVEPLVALHACSVWVLVIEVEAAGTPPLTTLCTIWALSESANADTKRIFTAN